MIKSLNMRCLQSFFKFPYLQIKNHLYLELQQLVIFVLTYKNLKVSDNYKTIPTPW